MLFLMSGTPGKETKKLVVLCVLFVIVLGAFLMSSRNEEKAERARQVSSDLPADVDGTEQPLLDGAMRVETAQDNTDIPTPSGDIVDGEGTIEEGYLSDILKTATSISADELKSRAKRVPFGDYFHNPDDWRGKVMRIEGRVLRLVEKKKKQLPKGIDIAVYEAQIIITSGYVCWVLVVEKPRFGTDALVACDGIFVKIHAYENRKGTTTRAPLFVCKNFEKLEIEPSSLFGAVGWFTVIVVTAGLIIAVLVTRSQRRSSEKIARAVEDKRLEKARQWAQSKKEEGDGDEA